MPKSSAEVVEAWDRRDFARNGVERPTTVRDEDHEPTEVTVRDLSSAGFSFVADRAFAVGTCLVVGLDGAGRSAAEIVRRDQGVHGCRFLAPLTAAETAAAFSGARVLVAPVGASRSTLPEPHVVKWPAAMRLGVLAGGILLSWSLVAMSSGLIG